MKHINELGRKLKREIRPRLRSAITDSFIVRLVEGGEGCPRGHKSRAEDFREMPDGTLLLSCAECGLTIMELSLIGEESPDE